MTARGVSVATVATSNAAATQADGRIADSEPKWLSIRSVLRPIFLCSRLCGLTTVSLAATEPPKSSGLVYCLVVATVISITQLIAAIMLAFEDESHRVRTITWSGVIMFNHVCGILCYLFLAFHRCTIFSAVVEVVALDDVWHPKNNKRAATYAYSEIAAFLVSVTVELTDVVIYVINKPVFRGRWIWTAFEIWQCACARPSLALLTLQWTNLVLSLAHHMDALRDELGKLYPVSQYPFSIKRTPPSKNHWMLLLIEDQASQDGRPMTEESSRIRSAPPSVDIATLRKLHRDIYNILQKLQSAYGMLITVGVCFTIVNAVACVFELRLKFDPVVIFWIAFVAMLVCLMVMPCQMLLDKTQKCADDLHRIMQTDINSDDRKELLDFSIQLLDLPLSCSACNFFLLDNRKLISVLGTVVTYVIILTQFETTGQRTSTAANVTNCTTGQSH